MKTQLAMVNQEEVTLLYKMVWYLYWLSRDNLNLIRAEIIK